MNLIKIIGSILVVALIVNFLLLIFVKGYAMWFWLVIIATGLLAYKVLPKAKIAKKIK